MKNKNSIYVTMTLGIFSIISNFALAEKISLNSEIGLIIYEDANNQGPTSTKRIWFGGDAAKVAFENFSASTASEYQGAQNKLTLAFQIPFIKTGKATSTTQVMLVNMATNPSKSVLCYQILDNTFTSVIDNKVVKDSIQKNNDPRRFFCKIDLKTIQSNSNRMLSFGKPTDPDPSNDEPTITASSNINYFTQLTKEMANKSFASIINGNSNNVDLEIEGDAAKALYQRFITNEIDDQVVVINSLQYTAKTKKMDNKGLMYCMFIPQLEKRIDNQASIPNRDSNVEGARYVCRFSINN